MTEEPTLETRVANLENKITNLITIILVLVNIHEDCIEYYVENNSSEAENKAIEICLKLLKGQLN